MSSKNDEESGLRVDLKLLTMCTFLILREGSKMTLNYRVIVERYPFPNELLGSSIIAIKSSLYLTKKTR